MEFVRAACGRLFCFLGMETEFVVLLSAGLATGGAVGMVIARPLRSKSQTTDRVVITECEDRPSVGVALICLASQLLGMALLAQCQRSLPQAAFMTSSLLDGYAA